MISEETQRFSSTQFRADSPKVYNQVQKDGSVFIIHRDRPPMVLITEEELKKLSAK